jgi:hypothetical protein
MYKPNAKRLLDEARKAYEPDADAQRRVGAAIAAALAFASGAVGTSSAAYSTIVKSVLAGKKLLLFFLGLGVLTTGIYFYKSRCNMRKENKLEQAYSVLSASSSEIVKNKEDKGVGSRSTNDESETKANVKLEMEGHIDSSSIKEHSEVSRTSVHRIKKSVNREQVSAGVSSNIMEEMNMIKKASMALNSNNPDLAMIYLNKHNKKFLNGMFAKEREGLKIIALCKSGKVEESEKRRKLFLKHSPNAPISARLRQKCLIRGTEDE